MTNPLLDFVYRGGWFELLFSGAKRREVGVVINNIDFQPEQKHRLGLAVPDHELLTAHHFIQSIARI
jgi:hypothetical protein